MAYLLSQRGYHLILVARREKELQAIASELSHGATVIAQDLSEPGSAQKLYNACRQKELQVDVLINNAGFGRVETHCHADLERLEQMNHLNITCLSSLSKLFGHDMAKRREGCILNVGSTASYLPLPFMANYAATKAFVNSFTRALRAELRPHGVQVCLLNPGPTQTEFGTRARDHGDFIKEQPGVMTAQEVASAGISGLFLSLIHI